MSDTAVPRRHPGQPLKAPVMVRAMALAWRVGPPDGERWRRLGEGLVEGDEPMDRLVDWMTTVGLRTTRPLFEQALADGIASLPDAPAPLREFFTRVEDVPDWVDRDLLARGGTTLSMIGLSGAYAARDIALIGGYQFSGFNQTLLRTGALEKGSNQRFAETLRWARDLAETGALDPQGVGYRSTLRVRLIHALVRRHVASMPDWSEEEWGRPVNQTDMAATLVGALIAPAVGALLMGVVPRPRDLDALAHVARYAGWLMGVEEEWLPTDFRDGIRVLVQTTTALATPDATTRQLAAPMVDDPLAWHYPRLAPVRRRLARAQHLSVTSLLGPWNLRTLGLPAHTVPWYPLLVAPANLARSAGCLVLPAARKRAAARGDRQVDAFLRTVTGGSAEIGSSVAQLRAS